MEMLRLIETIAAEADRDPVFKEIVRKIAATQDIFQQRGFDSNTQLERLSTNATWSQSWQDYTHNCGEVALRINEIDERLGVTAETLMTDFSIIAPVVAQWDKTSLTPVGAFLAKWTVATAIGATVGGIAIGPAADILANTVYLRYDFATYQLIVGLVLGLIIGAFIGAAQALLTQRLIKISTRWIVATSLGWSLALAYSNATSLSNEAIAIGLAVGLLQALIMKRHGWPIWVWTAITTVSYIAAYAISVPISRGVAFELGSFREALLGLLLGVFTGLPFLRHNQKNQVASSAPYAAWSRVDDDADGTIGQASDPIDFDRIASDIATGNNRTIARLDDLFFPIPNQWSYRKIRTGHWEFNPTNIDQMFITVLFLNNGGRDTVDDLMREVEQKGAERQWTFIAKQNRWVDGNLQAIDVLVAAPNGVAHRLINFCYNGLEYVIDIKTTSLATIQSAKPILEAWLASFGLRAVR